MSRHHPPSDDFDALERAIRSKFRHLKHICAPPYFDAQLRQRLHEQEIFSGSRWRKQLPAYALSGVAFLTLGIIGYLSFYYPAVSPEKLVPGLPATVESDSGQMPAHIPPPRVEPVAKEQSTGDMRRGPSPLQREISIESLESGPGRTDPSGQRFISTPLLKQTSRLNVAGTITRQRDSAMAKKREDSLKLFKLNDDSLIRYEKK